MRTEIAIVIIPEEAEAVIPLIRSITRPFVHLILYAAPFTKRMLHFNRLDYFCLPSVPVDWSPPSWLPFELGILAGKLYFEFSEYEILLNGLHINPENLSGHHSAKNRLARTEKFLTFLYEWLALRRQSQDISHTPMGYVCQGLQLRRNHPFFSTSKVRDQANGTNVDLFSSTNYNTRSEDEDYYDSEEDGEVEVVGADDDEDSDGVSDID